MSQSLPDKKEDELFSVVLLCISIVFYLFFAFYDGVVLGVDSISYIDMYTEREPLYCTFLAVLRRLFIASSDRGFYLTVVVFLQSLLAALAAWSLADYLKKEFHLSHFQTIVVLTIPLGTSLLCRFAAKRSSMYSNSILSEGITCSLFLIFLRYLLEFYYKKSLKLLILSSVLSFILISTRQQMYITLILLLVVIFWAYFPKKQYQKGILSIILCVCGILGSNIIFDSSYNLIVHEEFETHSSDNRFFATMVIYTSERTFGQNISDENARNLFYEVYDLCDAQGYLKHSAKEGWYYRVKHFEDNYDHIQIDTLWPAIHNFVYDHYQGNELYLQKKIDEITDQIIQGLLPVTWFRVLGCFWNNFLSGLIATVGKNTPALVIYSFIVYMIYIILLILHIKLEGMTRLAFLGIFTMLSVIVNVAVVSMVIFCQTRYTIYNMPMFYITLWIFLSRVRTRMDNY